jgi:arylsulfatase A-like enzyme
MDIKRLRRIRDRLRPREIEYVRNLYREEVAFTDEHLGRLFEFLRQRRSDRPVLVVFTADHGEEFMEHGWFGHTRTLYDELIRVPLVFWSPGVLSPDRSDSPTSGLDILPTLVEWLGLAAPPAVDGVSLTGALRGEGGPPVDRPRFCEVTVRPERGMSIALDKTSDLAAVVVRSDKLIHDLDAGTWEFYDLDADPDELEDREGEGQRAELLLRNLLEEWERGRGVGATPPDSLRLNEEERERLRSLGYIR